MKFSESITGADANVDAAILKEEIGEPVERNEVEEPSNAVAIAANIDGGIGGPGDIHGIYYLCNFFYRFYSADQLELLSIKSQSLFE